MPLASRADAYAHAEPHARRAVIVAIIVAEFLRSDRVEQWRDDRRVRDVSHLTIHRQLEAIGGRERNDALPRPVGKPIAAQAADLEAIVRRTPHDAGSHGEPFAAIDADQLAQRARAEALALESGEGPAARDATHFGPDVLEIVLADRLGDVLDRGAEGARPRKGIALGLGQRRDLFTVEPVRGKAQVEYVTVDFPASPDDAARRNVEPRGTPANLDLLAVGEPEPSFPQRIVQHDADVFELRIEIRLGGEVERHAYQLGGCGIYEQRAHDGGDVEILRPDAQRDHAHRSLRELDGGRVAQGEVVQVDPTGSEGVRHVAHLIALAQSHRAPEVVLHDAEVIAVVVDIGGELGTIAPADDALLAEPGRLPVHFQLQLVRLDEPRRLGEPFAELPQEEEKPVSLGLVVAQRRVDRSLRAALDGAPRQRQGGIAVPDLSGRTGCENEQQRGGPTHRGEI